MGLARMGWYLGPALVLGCGGRVIDEVRAQATGAAPPSALVTTTADPDGPCYVNAMLNPPGAVFVIVASQPITCTQTLPAAIAEEACTADAPFVWEVCVALPPSSLAVGTVDLTATGLNAEEMDAGHCNGLCCGGSTIFDTQGALEITAVDASAVSFALAGASSSGAAEGTVAANGTYTASRCP